MTRRKHSADKTEGELIGERIAIAQMFLSQCPESRLHSEAVRRQWQLMERDTSPEVLEKTWQVLVQLKLEKPLYPSCTGVGA